MSIIKIKRSSGTTAPATLALGELGYAYGSGTQANGGARVYLGTGGETGGIANAIDVIGGKYFVDLLDHAHGTLTASSAIIVDSNSKIDILNVDNITINGNTISSTDTNGNIILDPVGTGIIKLDGPVEHASTSLHTGLLTANGGITVTASNYNQTGTGTVTGQWNVDNLRLDGNVLSSTDTNGNITLTPNGTGYVVISGTNGLVIPSGTNAQQLPNVTGAIRYNTSNTQFEGYSGTNWSSLGGVRSVDGFTFIIAESAPAVSDDILHFYAGNVLGTAGVEVAQLDIVSLRLLQTTAASSTTTGGLVVSGGAGIAGNLHVGGNEVLTGDLAVNGGDITTSAATFNLVNATATTVNLAGAGTAVSIGAATGTLTIGNPTITGTNATTFNMNGASPSIVTTSTATASVFNTNATTGNLFGAATAINIGNATSATITLRPGTLVGSNTTQNVYNTVATTGNLFGAGTAVNIGATTGTLTLNNPTVVGSQTTVDLWNTTTTTINAFGAATLVNIGAATGTTNVKNNLDVDGDVNIDGGDLTVSTTTFNLANATATTVNFAGAGTLVNIGAATGTTNVKNNLDVDGDVNIDGGDLTVSTATFNLANTTATTVNFAGAGTLVNIGASSGTTTVKNNLSVDGNLTVNGTTTAVNSNVVTVDDPIITLGGDTSVVEITKDRGVEFKYAGATLTITNYIGNGTTTVTATVASTTGYAVGDIITISGATNTEQLKLNGTWTLATVPNATTFTFVIGSTLATATYTTTIGTAVRSKNGFFGLDQSTGYFTFIPQASNVSEVFSGTQGDIQATNFRGALVGNADTATKWATARTITLAGDLSGNVSIDGSANVTLTATVVADSVALGTDTTGNYVASAAAGATPNGIVVAGTGEGAAVTVSANLATTTGTIGTSTFDATNFDVVSGLVTIDTIDGGTF
jgi:hypothetical protein